MTKFVMGILVIQLLGGLYQMGVLMTSTSPSSTARATRLPDLLVFSHGLLGFLAAGLWLGQLFTGNDAYAWATLVVVLLSVGGGMVMFVETEFKGDTIDRPAVDPADIRVAEKQIPKAALHAHGLGAAVLLVSIFIVAL
jgi:predicted lipid-binding transport protein (Tim44 family)